jgi:hypothetical protein
VKLLQLVGSFIWIIIICSLLMKTGKALPANLLIEIDGTCSENRDVTDYKLANEVELVDWYRGYGATTPSHLGRKPAAPLCTAFSSARQPQRRCTSSDMTALWQRGTEMGEKWPTNFA